MSIRPAYGQEIRGFQSSRCPPGCYAISGVEDVNAQLFIQMETLPRQGRWRAKVRCATITIRKIEAAERQPLRHMATRLAEVPGHRR